MISALVGYASDTGEIRSQVLGMISEEQRQTLHSYGLSTVVVPGAVGLYSQADYYIHNGQPTPRPASPIDRSGLTLSNVPTGSTLFIDGTAYPAQGTVDLSFPLPGTYALRVECFPYLDFIDEVTV